jgi:hypothetical protein
VTINITTEQNPTPLVRLMASALRRATSTSVATRMGRMNGVAAIRSFDDHQAVTIRFRRGDIDLVHGVGDDVQVSITMDLNNDGLPGAPKRDIKGALRHLRFALGLSKVLDPPVPSWQKLADEFWEQIAGQPFLPACVRVVATDSREEHNLGGGSEVPLEIHGPSDRLVKLFTRSAFLAEEAQAGRIKVSGSLAAVIALTSAGLLSALDLDSVES